jgi:hypothetical protein
MRRKGQPEEKGRHGTGRTKLLLLAAKFSHAAGGSFFALPAMLFCSFGQIFALDSVFLLLLLRRWLLFRILYRSNWDKILPEQNPLQWREMALAFGQSKEGNICFEKLSGILHFFERDFQVTTINPIHFLQPH